MLKQRDAGVVAVVVALSVSTFLLGFAALSVDLGAAYLRRAQAQQLADRLALAAAAGLPQVNGADGALARLDKAVAASCAQPTEALAGLCQAPSGWGTDGDPSNGEVSFYTDGGPGGSTVADLNGDGTPTGDALTAPSAAGVVRVVLPPTAVPAGLGRAVGLGNASVSAAATARIGTPLGHGLVPFALTAGDLAAGRFCVRDPQETAGSYPGPQGWVFALSLSGPLTPDTTVTLSLLSFSGTLQNVQVHLENGGAVATTALGSNRFRFIVPSAPDGTWTRVWAEGTLTNGGGFRSFPLWAQYEGTGSSSDPCQQVVADRGYLQVARDSGPDLAQDVRTGPQPLIYSQIVLDESGAPLVAPVTAGLGEGADCGAGLVVAATACLKTVLAEPFAQAMTDGLLTRQGNRPGRLVGDCGWGTHAPGGYGGVDAARLFADVVPPGAPALTDSRIGSGSALRVRLEQGTAPRAEERGWLTSAALRCPRLVAIPVLGDPVPSVPEGRRVNRIVYAWIDGDGSGRGLQFSGSRVRAFHAWVVDPALFPPLVAGSPVVGPYLGASMPKEAVLLPDLDLP